MKFEKRKNIFAPAIVAISVSYLEQDTYSETGQDYN